MRLRKWHRRRLGAKQVCCGVMGRCARQSLSLQRCALVVLCVSWRVTKLMALCYIIEPMAFCSGERECISGHVVMTVPCTFVLSLHVCRDQALQEVVNVLTAVRMACT